MKLPFFVAGTLLNACFSPFREPSIRFLCKQIEILLRILADHGINRAICTPDERISLLGIGAEMNHNVKSIFLINTWATYRKWRREEKAGKDPGRPGRSPKFGVEEIALIVRIAKDDATFIKAEQDRKLFGFASRWSARKQNSLIDIAVIHKRKQRSACARSWVR